MSTRGRRTRLRILVLCACMVPIVSATLQSPVHGQRGEARSEPPRPRLAASADTNDAGAYHRLGASLIRSDPARAADAFYWALRLDPFRQDAVYSRRVALLLRSPQRLVRYMDGERNVVRSADMRAADSLYLRSLMMNPFMLRGYDDLLLAGYAEEWARSVDARSGGRDAGAVRHAIDNYMRRASPYMKAWFAYSERRFDDALREYGNALRTSRNKASLHAERAHVSFILGRLEDAETEMKAAIAEARRRDDRQVVYFYDSKALYEYSLGYVLHAAGRHDDAIEAYGRALQEDLSFHPAHYRTAVILLERSDTAGALASLALATAIETVDAVTRLFHALLLTESGDPGAAEAELAVLTEKEPHYARPYAERGRALERLGRTEEAVTAYAEYMERSSRGDPGRRMVGQRLEELRASVGTDGRP